MTTLTGGRGLIGAEVARLLVEREERPVLSDLGPSLRRLEDVASSVDIVRGDVGIFNHALDVVKRVRPTRIYHLGAMLARAVRGRPAWRGACQRPRHLPLLEAARLFDVPQVCFSSSIGTYGLGVVDCR